MREEIFRVRNADVKIANQLVLEKLNFQVHRGEILGILGTMDSGKTTLVNIISGEVSVASGYVYYKGQTVLKNGSHGCAHPKTTIISQSLHLVESMTVWENILLSHTKIASFGVRPKTTARVTEAMLQSYGIDLDPQTTVAQLGQEEQLLLRILCARMRKTEIIILDDIPFSYTTEEYLHLRELLEIIAAEGVTTIITSCQSQPLEMLSDRMLFLHNKHIVAELPAGDVRRIEGLLDQWFPVAEYDMDERNISHEVAISFSGFPRNNGSMVSFNVYAGQIVSVQDSTRMLIAELRKALTGSGKSQGIIRRGGKNLRPIGERMAQNGVVYINCSLSELLTESLSPADNICIGDYKRFSGGGIVKDSISKFVAAQFSQWYGNNQIMERNNCTNLSGVDKIALVLFRLKMMKPSVLILDEVIPSMDRNALELLERALKEIAQDGTAVCLWNTSIETLQDIADFNLSI